jgi:hypothetical protein
MTEALTLDEWATTMLDLTRKTKKEMCEQHHGPYDLQPLIHAIDPEGRAFVALLPDRDVIPLAVRELEKKAKTSFEFIGFCADAYAREYPKDADIGPVQKGELARLLDEGDFTITEQLVVSVIEVKTMDVRVLAQSYLVDDAGRPEFGEPEVLPDSEGGVINMLRRAARRSGRPT